MYHLVILAIMVVFWICKGVYNIFKAAIKEQSANKARIAAQPPYGQSPALPPSSTPYPTQIGAGPPYGRPPANPLYGQQTQTSGPAQYGQQTQTAQPYGNQQYPGAPRQYVQQQAPAPSFGADPNAQNSSAYGQQYAQQQYPVAQQQYPVAQQQYPVAQQQFAQPQYSGVPQQYAQPPLAVQMSPASPQPGSSLTAVQQQTIAAAARRRPPVASQPAPSSSEPAVTPKLSLPLSDSNSLLSAIVMQEILGPPASKRRSPRRLQ